jgi:hypothetical protein
MSLPLIGSLDVVNLKIDLFMDLSIEPSMIFHAFFGFCSSSAIVVVSIPPMLSPVSLL